MTRNKIRFFSFIKRMYKRYNDEQVSSIAGELSYFFLLSLFPFLFVLFQFISYLPIDHQELFSFLEEYAPAEAATLIRTITNQIVIRSNTGLLSLGIIGTLWSASRGSNAVIRGINRAFDVEEERPFWKVLLMSFMITAGLMFIIVFSLLIPVFGQKIASIINELFEISIFPFQWWDIIRFLITFIVLYVVFTFVYYIIPNKKILIKDVLPGSLLATAGWIATSLVFSFYVNNFSNYSATYGSIGGIIILMTWIYLSCIVLILGGILNSELILWRENKVQ